MWWQICLYEFPQSPFVFHENAVYCGIARRQKNFKNVSTYHIPPLKLLMRYNSETDRNKSAQYKVRSRHNKWLLLITENLQKNPTNFSSTCAREYLPKVRYAPAPCIEPSANRVVVFVVMTGISLINKRNIWGIKTEPWGTLDNSWLTIIHSLSLAAIVLPATKSLIMLLHSPVIS